MENQEIRTALDRHWAASAAGDSEAEHEIYHDDVLVEYPQSGERIRGRHNIEALRGHHPAKLGFTIRRIIGNGNLSAQAKLSAGALINEGGGTITVSAGANGATAALTVLGNLSNAGDLEEKPGGFIEAGSLDNEGILGLNGSAGAPTNFGVIGGATNAGALTIGAFAEMGVTGAMTDSGNIALAGTLANELASDRIRVNAVQPGLVDTPMTDDELRVLGILTPARQFIPVGTLVSKCPRRRVGTAYPTPGPRRPTSC